MWGISERVNEVPQTYEKKTIHRNGSIITFSFLVFLKYQEISRWKSIFVGNYNYLYMFPLTGLRAGLNGLKYLWVS